MAKELKFVVLDCVTSQYVNPALATTEKLAEARTWHNARMAGIAMLPRVRRLNHQHFVVNAEAQDIALVLQTDGIARPATAEENAK
jgi:hypothetical protein